MKRLKSGAVNSISFIKNIGYTINSFDVSFEKVVGSTALTLTDLQDSLELDSCSDFIVLNIDLLSNTIEGGEYYMTISNGNTSTSYLCEVENYQYNTHGTDIYSDSVVFSNDVTFEDSVENTDPSGTPVEGDGNTGELDINIAVDEVILFLAPDLTTAQSMYSAGTHLDGITSFVEISGQNGYGINYRRLQNFDGNGVVNAPYDISDFQNDNLRMYAVSSKTDTYYIASSFAYLEGTTNAAIPFATGYFFEPYHDSISLTKDVVTEVKAFGTGAMLPSLQGIGTASRVMFDFGITREEFIDDITAYRTINLSLPQGDGYADIAEWKQTLGQTVTRFLAIVDNDL
jgi:hypothetical protein